MRVLMIYRVNTSISHHSGVLKKMKSQQQALSKLGHTVSLLNHDSDHIYLNGEIQDSFKVNSRFKRYWFNFRVFFKKVSDKLDFTKFDLVYIRYPFSNPSFIRFCRIVKMQNPECKLLIEMPTFPYNQEFSGLSKIYPLIDNHYRKKLFRYVDRIVHFGSEKELFGIECINTTNGIDTLQIPMRSSQNNVDKLICLAMAKWFYWHGLDRFLEGLSRYDNQEKHPIELWVLGEGSELEKLRTLSRKLNLDSKVLFKGVVQGKELDDIFEKIDIGVGTLGIHRKNLNYNASLKHREYCARGIPFILSTGDSSFPTSCGFVKYQTEDDSPIDMHSIIQLKDSAIPAKEIRKYAVNNLEWRSVLERILEEAFKD